MNRVAARHSPAASRFNTENEVKQNKLKGRRRAIINAQCGGATLTCSVQNEHNERQKYVRPFVTELVPVICPPSM